MKAANDPIRVGRPDIAPDASSHVKGVRQGNEPGSYARMRGHLPDGRSTARRSTGVNPESREPILPGMPNLTPP